MQDRQTEYILRALEAELDAGFPAGKLFGESLINALAVHLQRRYGVTPPQNHEIARRPTASPPLLTGLDHVKYGNVPRVAGDCVSALNPMVGHQHPSCGKSLEDLGQCFMGQSIEFGQAIGGERTLASVFC